MSELLIVTLTLWIECRGESAYGRELVATVIWNRMQERGLPAHEVCIQPRQFSCWNKKPHIVESECTGPVWRHCRRLAIELCNGTFVPSNGANHYYNPALCSPRWAKNMQVIVREDQHVFLREGI